MTNRPPVAVVDTNVLLDIYSCHDLVRSFDRAQTMAEGARADPSFAYRLNRARESLLLAEHFHRLMASTCSLNAEPIALMQRCAPPAAGGLDLRSDFTTFFVHFVREHVLAGWKPMVVNGADETANRADERLISLAKRYSVPLITNEGFSTIGLSETKLRKSAREEGVVALAPREFYGSQADEDELSEGFLSRFRAAAPPYLADRELTFGKDEGPRVLEWIYRFYRFVLEGA